MPNSSHAALDLPGRAPKAEKIRRLLALSPAEADLRLLEVGAGSGAIARYFATLSSPTFKVAAVDTRDQRLVTEGYEFQTYDGQRLPFEDLSFDVVISNHVIEHVGDRDAQKAHLKEICRVLVPGGVFYLATPNRWQLVEPHFVLPFLGWLPRGLQDRYVRGAGRGERYDCNLLGPFALRRLLRTTGFTCTNLTVQAIREFTQIERPSSTLMRIGAALPAPLLNGLRDLSPTLIYLLRKDDAGGKTAKAG